MSPPANLHEAAARLGGHCWLELQLFEVAGRWVPETPEPAAKLVFDRLSSHGAWRAGQWRERLPVLAGIDRPGLVLPPGEAWGRCLSGLARLEGSAARLSGLCRVVLPRLAARYREHLSAAAPSAEAPVRRTLRMALADVTADRDDGDGALLALLASPASVEDAAAAVRLDAAFLGGGGVP